MSGVTVAAAWDPENAQASTVKMTVSYPFQPVVGLFSPVTLSSTSEMSIFY